jgi:hypothetical protein
MKLNAFLALVAGVLLLITTACTGTIPSVTTVPEATSTIAELPKPSSPVAALSPEMTSSQSEPTLPPRPQSTIVPAPVKGSYLINKQASSTQGALKNVHFILYHATLTDEHLILHIGFRNVADKEAYITGGLIRRDLRLSDAAGNEYEAIEFSDNLRLLSPSDGFVPGQANVGDVVFPIPQGGEPYQLQVPWYEPISFRLDQPMPSALQPPTGTYSITLELYSSQRALVPIILRVDSLTLTEDKIIFTLAFVNTLQREYYLGKGLTGNDARLLDAEFAAYKPLQVSTSLMEGISPPKGWLPGQAYVGEIAFPRPQQLAEMRFVFPTYATATLRFNRSGLVSAAITSASSDVPPPTVTPTAKQLVLRELTSVLERQANAVITGDLNAYLATFATDLQQEQQTIFMRSQQLPLHTYQLSISPSTVLVDQDWERGRIERIAVFLRYQLRGISQNNPFQHTVRYTFEWQQDQWIIGSYELEDVPPFWWTDDVIVQETPHFLIISRPGAETILNKVAQECEQAYRDLQTTGLLLEERFVLYFIPTQDDFHNQTRLGSRTLGAALSLYHLTDDQIQVIGRAFYINGEAFSRQPDDNGAFGRLATIRHELVHLALARETRFFTPIWLVEGAAMYFADQLTPDLRRSLLEDGWLDRLSLEQLTGAERLGDYDILGQSVGYEYIFSGETVRYLIETYGMDSFVQFYRFFSNVPTARVIDRMPLFSVGFGTTFGNLSKELTPAALLDVYGITIADLDNAVKRRLRER